MTLSNDAPLEAGDYLLRVLAFNELADLTVDLEFAFGSDDERAPSPFPRRDPGQAAAHEDPEAE